MLTLFNQFLHLTFYNDNSACFAVEIIRMFSN